MYAAIVSEIESVQELEGARTVKLARIEGESVIVPKSLEAGQAVLFFSLGGCLSPEFLAAHYLVRRTSPDGSKAGGYFEASGRVQPQTLCGVLSAGFAMPLGDALAPFAVPKQVNDEKEVIPETIGDLTRGTLLDTFNGHRLCGRYLTDAEKRTLATRPLVMSQPKYEPVKRHPETPRLGSRLPAYIVEAGRANEGEVIEYEVTEKVHGTSGATGYVPTGDPEGQGTENGPRFEVVTRSRNFILDMAKTEAVRKAQAERMAIDGGEAPWPYRLVIHKAFQNMKLDPHEVWYYEIAGGDGNGKPIQGRILLSAVASHPALPEVFRISEKKALPSDYSYGWKTPQVYVYRILRQVNGQLKDLSREEIIARVNECVENPHKPWFDWREEEGLPDWSTSLFDVPPLLFDGLIPGSHLEEGLKSLQRLLLYGMAGGNEASHAKEAYPALDQDPMRIGAGSLSLSNVWGENGPLLQQVKTLTEGFVVRLRPFREGTENHKTYPFSAFKVVNPLFRASEAVHRASPPVRSPKVSAPSATNDLVEEGPIDPEEVS